jgi:hypothetical protein
MSKAGVIDITAIKSEQPPKTATRPRGAQRKAGRPAAPVANDRSILVRLPAADYWRAKECASQRKIGSFNEFVRVALASYVERHHGK